ncbi:MAG: hypothetical protein HGJ94_14000 [Desulfosarcina sp.]|nr:hypothetical protein [Desulfosarcina sp.]MBC2741556.1 hypothetical protein [Desulfosarcina sp.]MBC2764470.1 hypothetical protein [Desulfosarcina sp.]
MTAGKEKKLTSAQIGIFKEECRYWIEKFGLVGWEIDITTGQFNDNAAVISFDTVNRWAVIKLSDHWPQEKITDQELRITAYHEVYELLLSKFRSIVSSNTSQDKQDVDEQIHIVIRTLENLHFIPDYHRRMNEGEI